MDYKGVVATFPGATDGCRSAFIAAGQLRLDYTPTVEFIAGDIGKTLQTSGSPTFSGTIVDFDTVAGHVWVTPDTLSDDTFHNDQSYTVVSGTGTGSYTGPPFAALHDGSNEISYNNASENQKTFAFFVDGVQEVFDDQGDPYCFW